MGLRMDRRRRLDLDVAFAMIGAMMCVTKIFVVTIRISGPAAARDRGETTMHSEFSRIGMTSHHESLI